MIHAIVVFFIVIAVLGLLAKSSLLKKLASVPIWTVISYTAGIYAIYYGLMSIDGTLLTALKWVGIAFGAMFVLIAAIVGVMLWREAKAKQQ
ncbi:hypothetical protein [Massilia sp. TS11]|uniref:hypothetical protein n=1 Tax=Massilia sp. TS11 TaxID=2908003 RepID=UPI001EDB64A7|nr:hypothetical protein [Massilia sp. TS11]MCG2585992.1 hypothetical protein [Massilia sp. TS11]